MATVKGVKKIGRKRKAAGLDFFWEDLAAFQLGGGAYSVRVIPVEDDLLVLGTDEETVRLVVSRLRSGTNIAVRTVKRPSAKQQQAIFRRLMPMLGRSIFLLDEPKTSSDRQVSQVRKNSTKR